MNEQIIRKLDSTTLKFTKLPEGRIEVVGNGVATEADSSIKLMASQAFQVRHQDGQLALVVQDFKKSKEVRDAEDAAEADERNCYAFLRNCGEFGGRQPAESCFDYLKRMVDAVSQLERQLTARRDYGMARVTHTYVTMEVSGACWAEIAENMHKADYEHAFMNEGEIDMHGIAIKEAPRDVPSLKLREESPLAKLLAEGKITPEDAERDKREVSWP